MPPAARTVIVQGGGGSAAGILLLLLAAAGLLALFTGNLDRLLSSFAGPAGGAAGISGSGAGAAAPAGVQDRAVTAPARTPARSGSPYAGKPTPS